MHPTYSIISRPVAATASRIARFTERNRERSLGSGKFLSLRIRFMTSWGRLIMGVCASNCWVSRESALRAALSVRSVAPLGDLEAMSCLVLWPERDLKRAFPAIKSQFPRTLRQGRLGTDLVCVPHFDGLFTVCGLVPPSAKCPVTRQRSCDRVAKKPTPRLRFSR